MSLPLSSNVICSAAAALAVLAVAHVCGCCGTPRELPPNESALIQLASNVSDAALTEDAFNALFVTAPALDEAQRTEYSKHSYRVTETDIQGDTAVMTVNIVDPATDNVLATADWSCQRDGTDWKLVDAPLNLPAGG